MESKAVSGEQALVEVGNVALLGSYNGRGQLNMPAGLDRVVAASASNHTLAIKEDGTLAAWGYNHKGQCNVPAGLTNVKAVAAGSSHSIVLKADGTLVAFGSNYFGESIIPAGLNNVKAVAAGTYTNIVLKNDGTVFAWGRNASGETVVPAGLKDVVAISFHGDVVLALKADGTVTAWGSSEPALNTVPSGLIGVKGIAASTDCAMALKNDGTVVAWGGSGSTCTVPQGLSNVTAVFGGMYNVGALKADGTVVLWGRNSYGEDNLPGGLPAIQGLAIGYFHNVLIKDISPPTAGGMSGGTGGAVNSRGEYCVNSQTTRITVSGVKDPSGVAGMRFRVIGSSYPNGSTQEYIYNGTPDGQGNWYIDLDFGVLATADSYTVRAFPVDNLGNTKETTELSNPDYPLKVTVKRETLAPTLSAATYPTDGASSMVRDGYMVTNTKQLRVTADVSDGFYPSSGANTVLGLLYKADGTLMGVRSLSKTYSDYWGNGSFETMFDLTPFNQTETKLRVRLVAKDYAGNSSFKDTFVQADMLSPRGSLSITGANPTTATTAIAEFMVYADASGLMGPPEFYVWTEANGQDDLEGIYGVPVAGTTNRYRATINRATHGNQTGVYHVHIWTRDAFGNFNWAAAKTLQMN